MSSPQGARLLALTFARLSALAQVSVAIMSKLIRRFLPFDNHLVTAKFKVCKQKFKAKLLVNQKAQCQESLSSVLLLGGLRANFRWPWDYPTLIHVLAAIS